MELPVKVLIHNEQLGLKGSGGTLIQIYPEGFYLISTTFGSKLHKIHLSIEQTVLIHEQAEEAAVEGEEIEIER
jgi:hypothetical protein